MIEASLGEAGRHSVIARIEDRFLAGLQRILGSAGRSEEGIDLVRIDVNALVFGRVRLFRIVRFLAAADAWLVKHPDAVRISPSLHYTDWLLARLLEKHGRAHSGVASALARVTLAFSDHKVYAPRIFVASPSVPSVSTDLLFVATMETHAKNLLPLMHAAIRRGKSIGIVVSSAAKSWQCLAQIPKGVPVLNFRDFIDADAVAAYTRDQDLYRARFRKDEAELRALFCFQGINLWPLVRAGVCDWYENVLPANRLYIRIARRILDNGSCMLMNSRVLKASETALAAVAQRRGVRVTTILHGLIGSDPDMRYAAGRFDLTDRIYVWNAIQKDIVERRRPASGDVVIEANPQWESKFQHADRPIIDRAGYAKVITFCAQPSNPETLWRDVIAAAAAAPRTLLIFKTHPTIPADTARRRVGHIPPNVRIVDERDAPLYQLLTESDLMITVSSTTLFEALIIGTPVLLYTPEASAFIEELRRYGAPAVSDPISLARVLVEDRPRSAYWADCREFRSCYLGPAIDYRGAADRILSAAYGTSRD